MKTEEFEIHTLIRYFLSGLIGLVFLIIVPMYVENYGIIKNDIIGVFGVITLSFAIGYLIDCLKLYSLTRGYKRRKKDFLKKLSDILKVRIEEASVYYSAINQISNKSCELNIGKKHAEWILLENIARIFLLSIPYWIYKVISTLSNHQLVDNPIYLIMLFLISLITLRLFKNASQEREKMDRIFLKFAENNRSTIHSLLKIKDIQ
jgi:hypothetical protein